MTPEAIGSRISTLAGEARLQEIVPVARGFSFRHQLRVEDDDRQGAEGAEVEVARAARARRHGVRPRRPVGREQAVAGGAGEDRVRTAEPDVALRIGLLRADPVVDLLRRPCRASARRSPDASPRTPARRASAGPARAANRPSPASARRSSAATPARRASAPCRRAREGTLASSCGL